MNPLTKFIRDRFVEPASKQEIGRLKKELGRAQSKLEEKSFDLLSSLTGNPGSKSSNLDYDARKIMKDYVSWAYANITVIAEKVASIDFELYSVSAKDGSLTEIESHEALDLLNRVNDYQTKYDLIYTTECHLLAMGEAAWYLTGKKNEMSKPNEIWILRPEYLKIIPGDLSQNQFIKNYEYRLPGKPATTFEPWEILFFKTPHPSNMYRGYGVLEAALTDVLTDFHATNYNKSFFENFARPDGVLSTDSKLSDEVYNRLKQSWSSSFEGQTNAGKTAILESGLAYSPISPSAKDMDFLEQNRWIRDKIMAMFKNTKTILGITEDVNRANAEASEASWIKHNIDPKMARIVDHLNEFLMPVYGSNLVLGYCDIIPEDEAAEVAEYTAAVDKWMTRNEIREEIGLDPVDGGDFLFVGLGTSPIDGNMNQLPQLPATPPATTPTPTSEPMPMEAPKYFMKLEVKKSGKNRRLQRRYAHQVKVVKQRVFREKQIGKLISKKMKELTVKVLQARIKGLKDDGTIAEQTKQQRWEVVIKIASVFEKHAQKIVEAVIMRHKDKTLALLEDYKPKQAKLNVTKALDDFLPDDADFVTLSIDALTPILNTLVQEQGQNTLDFLGSPLRFDFNRAIADSINEFVDKASTSYINTVAERIGRAIQAGIDAGDSSAQMATRITQEYSDMSKYSAFRVARTETIRASNYATQQSFIQSQVVTGEQWFTALDERVCPFCEDLDGKIFDVGDTIFEEGDTLTVDGQSLDFGYGAVEYPPLHADCRCTLSPVITNRSIGEAQNRLIKQAKENPSLMDISKLDQKITNYQEETDKRLAEIQSGVETAVEGLVKTIKEEEK